MKNGGKNKSVVFIIFYKQNLQTSKPVMFLICFWFMETFNHVNAGKSTSNMLLSEEQSDDPKYKRGRIYKNKNKNKMQNVEVNIFKKHKTDCYIKLRSPSCNILLQTPTQS